MDFNSANTLRQRILDETRDPMAAAAALTELFEQHPEVYDALHMQPGVSGLIINNPGPDANLMTEKYLRNTQNAGPSYVAGMQNPRRDPKAAALRAKGKWKDRMQQAIQHDTWAKGIQGADYQEAVRIATEDGGAAYTSGIQKRAGKVAKVFTELAPHFAGVSQAIQNMPQDTDGQREQRLLAARRGMIQIGQRRRGIGGATS